MEASPIAFSCPRADHGCNGAALEFNVAGWRNTMGSRTRFAVAMALLQCVAMRQGLPASAQAPDKADAAAARKEGNLSWYTSTPVALAQQLADKFQEQSGIKVQLLRTGGQAVLRRLQQEVSARPPGAHVRTLSHRGAAKRPTQHGP